MDFLLILLIHLFALLTPGPDFLLISSYALKTDFKKALSAVFGVSLAIFIWIIVSLSGLKLIFQTFPLVKILLSVLGAFYLLYLAFLLLKNLNHKEEFKESSNLNKAFANGFLTNITNAKALFYFGSIFSSLHFIDDFFTLSFLVFILTLQSFIYFALIAFFFSNLKIKNLYFKHYKKIDFVCAMVFIIFALFIIKNIYQSF